MLDQTFSAHNFENIYQIENRKCRIDLNNMPQAFIGFLFAFLALVAFVGCLVEGFMLDGYYVNALVVKGKGIITLLWAIFSIVVTIVVMWGHRLNLWTTLLAIAILLVLFFVPYLLCRKYSDRIDDFLYNRHEPLCNNIKFV